MKKVISASILSCLLCSSLFSADFKARLLPAWNITQDKIFNSCAGATLSLDVAPVNFRKSDNIYFSLQGSMLFLNADSFSNLYLYDAAFAAGYECRILDRFSTSLEGIFGAWQFPENKDNNLSATSGLSYGGRLFANYYALPSLIFSAFGGYKYYANKDNSFFDGIELGAGISYNFSKGIFASNGVIQTEHTVQNIFPVFYSHYDDHGFGTVNFINNETNDIKNVEVSVFIEAYMANPKVSATFPLIKSGEEFSCELTAFLNENILNSLQNQKTDAKIIITYTSLGQKMRVENLIELNTLSRNSMTWEDDRRAAAFVSGKDASALKFAKRVKALVKNDLYENVPVNLQYAAAIYGALKTYGINYVVDPSSAFTDNTGTSSVDFLQFPYQTILYHGGDCDDLSILNCALLEAIGIKTAFITVPGHIYMAFDSGLTEAQAKSILVPGKYIVKENIVWIPVEITLCQDSFYLAWAVGLKQWTKAGAEANLIPIHSAWEEYNPVCIPESDVSFSMPSRDSISKSFYENLRPARNRMLK